MIYLARHGRTRYNELGLLNGRFNDPLVEEGERQAEKLAVKCLELNIRKIYSSPLARAFVTARKVADILGIKEITVYMNLMERDFGDLTHKPASEIEKLSGDILRGKNDSVYFLSGPGVETFPNLIKRVQPVYEEISFWKDGLRSEDGFLVVSHGDVMKAIEATHRRVDFKTVLLEGHYQNCEIVRLM